MIGAVVFVVCFVLFTLVSFLIDLPPGVWVHDWFNLPVSDYSEIINAIVNGVVYGFVIWLIISLGRLGRKKKPVGPLVYEGASEVEELGESKIPIELMKIKGIGPRRAEELEAAGVRTVADLAKRSAKNLSEKTGIPIKEVSKWILQANEMLE